MGDGDKRTSESGQRKKLKLLAFHGYRQNASSFRGKIGSFRKTVAKYAVISFISAPHTVKSEEGEIEANKENGLEERGWWFNAEDNSFSGKRLGGPAIGFSETLRLVEQTVADHGPFDGFVGFSQGGCLVGILSSMQQKGLLPYKFNFAILVSAFCSGSLTHKGFYDEEIDIPSLHIYGESDQIIPKEMSDALINCFQSPMAVEHSGGHYFACSGCIKDKYQDFLSDRLQDALSDKEENEKETTSV